MITGIKKVNLTTEAVLQKISEYDIFRRYARNKFELNQTTYSCFRYEDHPSMLIGNRNGYLYFIDFGDTSKRGDCFTFVQQLYNLSSLDEVLKMIDRDFGLGIIPEHNSGEYRRIRAEYKQPEESLGKRYSIIQVVTRKFTNDELGYWNDYHQDIQDLRGNHIYSIDKLFLNRKRFPLKDSQLRFGYLYEGSFWKIYQPYESKKNKWLSNVPITVMEGKENIKNCGAAFINKSKKDHMVIKKVYQCSCAIQNEGVACFSDENVEFLKANSDRQILSFDSDVPGVVNSQQITKLFNFDYCNVPRKYLSEGLKDWADLVKSYNLELIEQILKEKQIL